MMKTIKFKILFSVKFLLTNQLKEKVIYLQIQT